MPSAPPPAAPAPLGDEEFAALAGFRLALRTYLRFSELAAEKAGLTGQQYQAMLVVRSVADAERMTINELARQLLIKHNSAVGLVDRLVEQGLLARRAAADDRRKVRLQLTARGLRVLNGLVDTHREELLRSGAALRRLMSRAARLRRGDAV